MVEMNTVDGLPRWHADYITDSLFGTGLGRSNYGWTAYTPLTEGSMVSDSFGQYEHHRHRHSCRSGGHRDSRGSRGRCGGPVAGGYRHDPRACRSRCNHSHRAALRLNIFRRPTAEPLPRVRARIGRRRDARSVEPRVRATPAARNLTWQRIPDGPYPPCLGGVAHPAGPSVFPADSWPRRSCTRPALPGCSF